MSRELGKLARVLGTTRRTGLPKPQFETLNRQTRPRRRGHPSFAGQLHIVELDIPRMSPNRVIAVSRPTRVAGGAAVTICSFTVHQPSTRPLAASCNHTARGGDAMPHACGRNVGLQLQREIRASKSVTVSPAKFQAMIHGWL